MRCWVRGLPWWWSACLASRRPWIYSQLQKKKKEEEKRNYDSRVCMHTCIAHVFVCRHMLGSGHCCPSLPFCIRTQFTKTDFSKNESFKKKLELCLCHLQVGHQAHVTHPQKGTSLLVLGFCCLSDSHLSPCVLT